MAGKGPLCASVIDKNNALSRTERVMQWSLIRAVKSGPPGLADTVRPRLGLKPNKPQTEAGMRIEPPASLAWASGTMPAATAAAAPPEEPAAERERSQGLCVTPSCNVSGLPSIAN